MAFPKKLHIIWVGGRKPIVPSEDADSLLGRILTWGQKLPGWEINLWTETDRSIQQEAAETLTEAGVKIHDVHEELLDPARAQQWAVHVQEEITGTQANFGAASDILRVLIVHRFGGLYTDLDNFADAKVRDLDGMAAGSDLAIGLFAKERYPNNAAVGGPAGSAFLKSYFDEMVAQYTRRYDPTIQDADVFPLPGGLRAKLKQAYAKHQGNAAKQQDVLDAFANYVVHFHRGVDRLYTTLDMTGPRLLRWLLAKRFMGFGGTFQEYLDTGEADHLGGMADALGNRAIPIDVLRITSENSWGGDFNEEQFASLSESFEAQLDRFLQ